MGVSSTIAGTLAGARKTRQQDEIVVFWIVRASACAESGRELTKGSFLRIERERPLCLRCADLDRLVFLGRGDAALTRRASQHSTLRAVVVRFSRARNHYERQGLLVEEHALVRAEQECLSDAEARRLARARAAERRQARDAEYVAAFAQRVGELYPGCPGEDRLALAEYACVKYSGRVGRSAAAKELQAHAVELAVRAHVRHVHTRYDQLLASGVERADARAEVAAVVAKQIETWQQAASYTAATRPGNTLQLANCTEETSAAQRSRGARG